MSRACILLLLSFSALVLPAVHAGAPPVATVGGDDERVAKAYEHISRVELSEGMRALTGPLVEALNAGDQRRAARYLLLMAYAFRSDDNDVSACQCSLLAHKLDPDNALALVLSADYLYRCGRFEEGDRMLTLLEKFPPDQRAVMRGLALKHSTNVNMDESEKVTRAMVEKYPDEVYGRRRLAGINSGKGNKALAAQYYSELSNLMRDDYQKNLYAGHAAFWSDDKKAAEDFYQKAGIAKPDDPGWLDALAMMYMSQGKFSEARKKFEQAVACPRFSTDARLHYAAYFIFTGEPIKATKVLRQLVKVKPFASSAHHSLAENYKSTGRLNEAEQEYRRAIELSPRRPQSYSSLLSMERIKNDQQKYQELVATWKRNCPASWEVRTLEGGLRLREQDWKGAQECFARANELKPKSRPVGLGLLRQCEMYAGLSTSSYKLNDLKGALASAKAFNELKPPPVERGGVPIRPPRIDFKLLTGGADQVQAAEHALLADALYETSQLDDCVVEYNKAAALEPDNINWHAALLKVYMDKKDLAGAAKEDFIVSQHMINKLAEAVNFGKKPPVK